MKIQILVVVFGFELCSFYLYSALPFMHFIYYVPTGSLLYTVVLLNYFFEEIIKLLLLKKISKVNYYYYIKILNKYFFDT